MTNPLLIGAYHAAAPADLAQTKSLQRSLSQPLDVLNIFRGWTSAASKVTLADLRRIDRAGPTPMITWEPWDYTQPELNVVPLTDILDGEWDWLIGETASICADFAKPVLLRFAHEFNGHWYPWSGHPPEVYARAFRYIVELFRRHDADQVRFVWCPNAASGNPRWDPYYPGDEWVDLLGIDGYNWPLEDEWRQPQEIFADSVRVLRELAPGKPILICETGTPEGPGLQDKATWIRELFAFARDRELHGIVWFDAEKEYPWQLNSSPQARRAFLRAARKSG